MNPIHSQWFKKAQCLFLGHDYLCEYHPGPTVKMKDVKPNDPISWDISWEDVWLPATRIACRRCGEELIIK